VNDARPPAAPAIGVTGASGFLGRALGAWLEARGHRVRRFVRGKRAVGDEIAWEPTRGRIDAGALAGLDAVVHLSGAGIADTPWTPERKRLLLESRAQTLDTLSRALASCPRPPRVLIAQSAVGWYGDRGDEELDESSPAGHGFLAELAHDWEAAARPARHAGVRVAHARTGLVLARGAGLLARLERPFAMGLGGPLGGGRAWWSWIALVDFIRAIAFAIGDERIAGPFNAVAPAPVRQAEFAHALGHALRRPAVLHAPAFALRLMLGRERANELLLASQRVRPIALLAAGFRFDAPELEPLLAAMYPPRR